MWDTAKVLRGKFISLSVHITKEETPEINNRNSHFKKLGEKKKFKARRKKERIGFIGWLETMIYSEWLLKDDKTHCGLQNANTQLNKNHKKIKLINWLDGYCDD